MFLIRILAFYARANCIYFSTIIYDSVVRDVNESGENVPRVKLSRRIRFVQSHLLLGKLDLVFEQYLYFFNASDEREHTKKPRTILSYWGKKEKGKRKKKEKKPLSFCLHILENTGIKADRSTNLFYRRPNDDLSRN